MRGRVGEIQFSWRDERKEICCRRFCSSPHPSVTFDSPRLSTTSPSPGEPSTCAQRCPCLFHFDAALPPPASSHTWPIRYLHRPVMLPGANPPGERVRGDDAPYPATKALLHSRPPLLPSRPTFPLSSSPSHSHRHLLTLIVTFSLSSSPSHSHRHLLTLIVTFISFFLHVMLSPDSQFTCPFRSRLFYLAFCAR